MLVAFLEHRKIVLTRRTHFELKQAEARLHILDGLLIALKNLDAVINLIRESKDAETARSGLMKQFGLTQLQAQAILDLTLRRLTSLEREKIETEHKETVALIARLQENSRRREGIAEADRGRTRRNQKRIRRSAPHPDHRSGGRVLGRGSDRRGGRAGHRHARRLHQAHPALALSHAKARRPRQDRRDHQRRRFRRASRARSRRTTG